MTESVDLTRLGGLLGDAARVNMLLALFRVPALTATELANEGRVTRATASSHLRRLEEEGLLRVRPAGRHRYYELADDEVAAQLEQMLGFAQHLRESRGRQGPVDPELRRARRCYDHLAGEIAVTVFDRLQAGGAFARKDGGIELTAVGEAALGKFGAEFATPATRRPACRECLDWSQRRPHLAGAAGGALMKRMIGLGWLIPVCGSRSMIVTARGEQGLAALFVGRPSSARRPMI
jgi:DNA-binding transcriptional ArsR family regulator